MNTMHRSDSCRVSVTMVLVALALSINTRADEPKQRLLAEFVPSSVFATSPMSSNSATHASGSIWSSNRVSAVPSMQVPTREPSSSDRWEQFESEFGVHQKDPSLVKGSLESAKYQLDRTVFAANEFVENVKDRLSFDYTLHSLKQGANSSTPPQTDPSSGMSLWDAVENAHFKSDIDFDPGRGNAFVGVQLVLPLGN